MRDDFYEWLNRLLCRLFGHRWHYWERGIVIDDGQGPPQYAGGFSTCNRCDARK